MSRHHESHSDLLFRWLGARLTRLALRHRVPPSDCEDCAQQAILALLIAHPDWPIESPRTVAWLCGVACHAALNYHRRQRRFPILSLDKVDRVLIDEPPLSPEPDVDRDDTDGAIAAKARALLDHLPDTNREIVIRRVQDGLSFSCLASAGNGETPHPSYTTTRQESHHAKASEELYACREGRHPAASPDRPRPRL